MYVMVCVLLSGVLCVLKFSFSFRRVLVLGNAQLAQMVGARGPNMQTNAACAGSTLAVAMAQVKPCCSLVVVGVSVLLVIGLVFI